MHNGVHWTAGAYGLHDCIFICCDKLLVTTSDRRPHSPYKRRQTGFVLNIDSIFIIQNAIIGISLTWPIPPDNYHFYSDVKLYNLFSVYALSARWVI